MRARVRDTELYFDVDGMGLVPDGARMAERPTLFLVHGGPGGEHSRFKTNSGALRAVAQLVYVDHRGSGRSAEGDPATYTLDNNIDDLDALREHLGLPRISMLGSSYGGMVAQGYALRYPERVANLILVCTAPSYRFIGDARAIVKERCPSVTDSEVNSSTSRWLIPRVLARGRWTSMGRAPGESYQRRAGASARQPGPALEHAEEERRERVEGGQRHRAAPVSRPPVSEAIGPPARAYPGRRARAGRRRAPRPGGRAAGRRRSIPHGFPPGPTTALQPRTNQRSRPSISTGCDAELGGDVEVVGARQPLLERARAARRASPIASASRARQAAVAEPRFPAVPRPPAAAGRSPVVKEAAEGVADAEQTGRAKCRRRRPRCRAGILRESP